MAVAYQPSPSPQVRFEWINESWQLFQSQAGTWIAAMLICLAFGVILWVVSVFTLGMQGMFLHPGAYDAGNNPLANSYAMQTKPAYWILVIFAELFTVFLTVGLMRMANAQLRGQPISPGMIFQGGAAFWPFLAYQIVLGILYFIGFVACFLPLFVVYALFTPGLALIADGVPFSEAMSRSFNAMSKDWLMGGLFVIVFMLIYIVSAFLCGLGFFVVVPMFFLILALVYRDMFGMPGLPVVGDGGYAFGAAQPGVWPPAPGSTPQPPNTWPSSGPLAGSSNPPNSYPPPPSSSSDAWPTSEPNASSDEEESTEPPDPV